MGKNFVGTGTIIRFSTHTTFLPEVLSITPPGLKRPKIDCSHMESANGVTASKPGKLTDIGGMSVDVAFDPETLPPIIDQDEETITITFSDDGASVWSFTGYITEFVPSVPMEGRATGTLKIEVNGIITVS